MTDLLPTGDNGQVKLDDYKFLDYGDDLMSKIMMMPKLDMNIFNYSQYTDPRYYTGCTIMSAINAISTIENKIFTRGDITSVFDKAEAMGWKPGYGWMRGSGWDCVRKRWNEKYPTNKMMLFTLDIFTPEFDLVLDKLGIVGISISVDSKYRSDVRDNLILDSDDFVKQTGHATDMMRNLKYFCVDSVYQKDKNIAMTYVLGDKDKIKRLNNAGNIRTDCHLIIMEKWLRGISPEERIRLESYKEDLNMVIAANSRMYNKTTEVSEQKRLNEQNNYNRGKLAIINAMLS